MTKHATEGVLTALLTPFAADGEVDELALAALIDFQVERGVDGLFVLGTSGEGLLMTPDERMGFTELTLKLVAGRVPVVVHCGAADTASAVSLARHAGEVGVSHIATIPPLFFPYDDESQLRHFSRIARAAPQADHYVYDNPGRTGYGLGPDLVLRLIREIPNLRGLKDTGDSLGRITGYLCAPEPPIVYTGNNVLLLPSLLMGAAGSVSTLANVVPELFAHVVGAYRGGEWERARAYQLTIARLQTALEGLPYIAAVKYLMGRRGLAVTAPRSPLPGLDVAARSILDARVDAIESLRPWISHDRAPIADYPLSRRRDQDIRTGQ